VLRVKQIICLLVFGLFLIAPATAPAITDINQLTKFFAPPGGSKTTAVKGPAEVIHGIGAETGGSATVGDANNVNPGNVSGFNPSAEYRAANRLVKALMRNQCPRGLTCIHNGPPARIVHLGDTLWGLARYYLGSGKRWVELCTPRRNDPEGLLPGEIVSFC
jgi:hypothetical protein